MAQPRRRNISQESELIYDVQTFGIISDTRELFLSSYITDSGDEEIDFRSANMFIRNLRILNNKNHNPIIVHIISVGGEYEYGMAIYDAIKHSQSDITTLSYAHSRSVSSIIPQAAKYRVIMPNAFFLAHYGTFESDSKNATSIIQDVKWLEKQNEDMLDVYVEKCQEGDFWKRKHMDKKEIREWLRNELDKKQEVYLTPRESVDMGFMDAVFGDEGFESFENLRD